MNLLGLHTVKKKSRQGMREAYEAVSSVPKEVAPVYDFAIPLGMENGGSGQCTGEITLSAYFDHMFLCDGD